MNKVLIGMFFLGLWYFCTTSCTSDTFLMAGNDCDTIPTYDTNMQEIVDRNCAYTGCHNGSAGVSGNYTSYQGMSIHFGSSIMNRVVSLEQDPDFGMPPDYASGPINLSDDDFKLFNCWITAEFPEN